MCFENTNDIIYHKAALLFSINKWNSLTFESL